VAVGVAGGGGGVPQLHAIIVRTLVAMAMSITEVGFFCIVGVFIIDHLSIAQRAILLILNIANKETHALMLA
jgi:hypothetical protein